MLEGLRAAQNTWIGKTIMALVVGFIIVAFSIFGIGDIFRGFTSHDVARVGSVTVSTRAFAESYQRQLQALQQRYRRPVTNEEAHARGLDSQILARSIADAVLDDRAAAFGLAIADTDIAKAIRTDPTFAGPGGAFDRGKFNEALHNAGMNEQSFVQAQRETYLRQEVVEALTAGLVAPEPAIAAVHWFQDETRSLDTIELPASLLGDSPAPDHAVLQSFFDAHEHDFEAPQYRKLVVLSLTPATIAKPEAVSDEDARKLYDAVKEQRYGLPERRHLQQMLFAGEAEATAASARIKSGTPFEAIVAERKLSDKDVDLGTVTRASIYDKAVADAAFALPAAGVGDPVKGAFGYVLIRVVSIEPPNLQPFEQVAAALKQEIALRRAGATIDGLRKTIEDQRSEGKTLTEAAQKVELTVREIAAVDAAGKDKAGMPIEGIANFDAVLKAAFLSDVGVDNDIVQARDGGATWFEVAGIEPAHPRTLAEVEPAVLAAWRVEDTKQRLAAKAGDIVKALQGGQSVEQAAEALGHLPVVHIADAKRAGATDEPREIVSQVFKGPVGSAGAVAKGETTMVVFKVLDSVVPPLDLEAADSKSIADSYRTILVDDIVGTYQGKVAARIGTTINQEALRTAVGAGL